MSSLQNEREVPITAAGFVSNGTSAKSLRCGRCWSLIPKLLSTTISLSSGGSKAPPAYKERDSSSADPKCHSEARGVISEVRVRDNWDMHGENPQNKSIYSSTDT